VGKQRTITGIGQGGERQFVLVDKPLVFGVIATCPGNSYERDLVTELLLGFLDRGSFLVADASSGGPEPKRRWLTGKGRKVDLASTKLLGFVLKDFWHGGSTTLRGCLARRRWRLSAAVGQGDDGRTGGRNRCRSGTCRFLSPRASGKEHEGPGANDEMASTHVTQGTPLPS
jgi:hypothetical protein